MNISLIVIDNFLPNFTEVRAMALSTPFETKEYQGHQYSGIGIGALNTLPLIEEVLGIPLKEHLSFFRLGKGGEPVTGHIHADINCGSWASVLYLNEPDQCRGGTAFWYNKRLGSDTIPPPDVMDDAGPHYSEKVANEINGEANDESKWELKSVIAMKSNRLILYPTNIFHSRYPRDGFGSDAQDGRLIHVSFFSPA